MIAEDDNRQVFAQATPRANALGEGKRVDSVQSETHENQVGGTSPGEEHRVLFIPRGDDLAAGGEEAFYSVTSLLHILDDKDDGTPVSIGWHTSPSLPCIARRNAGVCAMDHIGSATWEEVSRGGWNN